MIIKNLTFGSDPEYFVINETTKKILSSINIVEGTKNNPEPLGDGYFILKDNILVEGNIPPAKTMYEFINNMAILKQKIISYLKSKYASINVVHADCLTVDLVFLSHPEALEFGCSPYLNAWDNEVHRANDLSSEDYRTAGFHIHIGYDKEEEDAPFVRERINTIIARAFDLFVTIPSCMIHVDQRRFENYGGLGQYRDTSYGLECRSLGAFFVDEKYLPWVCKQVLKAIDYIQDENNFYHLLYMAKPDICFKSGIFMFDSYIYEELNIPFNEQLVKINDTIHA